MPPTSQLERELAQLPPMCARCGYVLNGLASPGECPECGRRFDLADARSFTRKPMRLWWKYWLPPFVLSAIVGLASMIFCVVVLGSWGYGAFLAAPLCAGTLLGYGLRVSAWFVPLLALLLGISLIFGLMTLQLAGLFCAMILAGIFLVPVLFGSLCGWTLRNVLKTTRFSQRWHLPALLAFALPIFISGIEGPSQPGAIERVSSSQELRVPADRAWSSLMYYEEVTHEPPWILKVGLARPLSTTGRSDRVGEIKRCLYNKGAIAKQVTRVEVGRALDFRVVEQQIGYETSVQLLGGGFHFEPVGDDKARVTLTTEYRPFLEPRLAWRPAERLAIRILHDYVLEGMRRKAEDERPAELAMQSSHEREKIGEAARTARTKGMP
jgi:hypothetical protein